MNDRLQDVASGRAGRIKAGWFGGRANRREYWLFVGPLVVASLVFAGLGQLVLSLLASIPILCFWIRRLHDLGHTGWWAPVFNVVCNVGGAGLMYLLPGGVGALITLVVYLGAMVTLGVLPGEARANEFGSPPGAKTTKVGETFA